MLRPPRVPPLSHQRKRRSRCHPGCSNWRLQRQQRAVCCAPPIPLTTTAIRSGPASRSSPARRRSGAARWCTGCCNRCPISRSNAATRPRCPISCATPTAWSEGMSGLTLAEGAVALIAVPHAAHACSRPAARPRCSIVGRLDRRGQPPALVAGQIDRLVVTARGGLDRGLSRPTRPPPDAAEPPPPMSGSLRSTGRCSHGFIPRQPIRAALLWTEALEYMEISAPALDAALASFISA